MNVDEVLRTRPADVLTVGPEEPVLVVARLFEQKRKGLIAVCDDEGRITGVVSLGDVVHAIGHSGAEALDLPVRTIMTTNASVCRTGDSTESALDKMRELGVRHLPVVDDNDRPVGLLEEKKALEVMYEDAALDFAQLRGYVFKAGARS